MKWKLLWAALALLVIVAALAAYEYRYQKNTAGQAVDNETPYTKNPDAPGIPIFGSYVSSNTNSVTIKMPNGSTRIFTLSASTSVISTVEAGQIAGTLASQKVGAQLVVVHSADDATVATTVEIVPAQTAPITVSADNLPVNFVGPVTSHSATSLVVSSQPSSTPVTVAITKNTRILSNVPAGKKGKDLNYIVDGKVGVSVQAIKTDSAYTALSVQILIPIN